MVYPRYEIVTFKEERIIRVPPEDLKDRNIVPRLYSPADVDSLFTHLAKVKDEGDLWSFVDRFGLLGLENRKVPSAQAGDPLIKYQRVYYDFVNASLEEARQIAKVVNDIHDLDSRLETLERLRPDVIQLYEKIYLSNLIHYSEWESNLKDANFTTLMKADIAIRISEHLGGIRPTINIGQEGEISSGYAYLSLYDVVWHQLFFALTKCEKIKICPECLMPHTGQGKFCPKPPFVERSICENNYHQKQHYRIKKKVLQAYRDGKTPDTIAKELDINIVQVEKWIAKAKEAQS